MRRKRRHPRSGAWSWIGLLLFAALCILLFFLLSSQPTDKNSSDIIATKSETSVSGEGSGGPAGGSSAGSGEGSAGSAGSTDDPYYVAAVEPDISDATYYDSFYDERSSEKARQSGIGGAVSSQYENGKRPLWESGGARSASTNPPEKPSIASGPSGVIKKTYARFKIRGEGSHRCRLNNSWGEAVYAKKCFRRKTYRNLRNGSYTFEVWSVNAYGESERAYRDFQVETPRPLAADILSKPPRYSDQRTAVFIFDKGNNTKQVSFLCSLNKDSIENAKPCSSPKVYNNLPDGTHLFRLWTVDRAGNYSTQASYYFEVDTSLPDPPTIVSGPSGPTTDISPTFQMAGENYAAYRCSLDSASYSDAVPCRSTFTYALVEPGPHVFRVWQVDRAGNVSAGYAERSFEVVPLSPSSSRSLSQRVHALRDSPTPGGGSYDSADTLSSASTSQALALEIDPAVEMLAVGADADTVSPQPGGDTGSGDDAVFSASVDLRSNLGWTSSATESEGFGLVASSIGITGDGDTGSSNGLAAAGDGIQNYGVDFAIDVSWADDASPEAAPYDASIDHQVANSL